MSAREHPSFSPPDDPNARIWRYIDLPKLVSFLMTRSIHLTRLTDLSDNFEGRLPPHAVTAVNGEFDRTERLCDREPEPDPWYADAIVRWARESTYVNCWCCHPHESDALWRIYNYPCGVAICTTFSKLAAALPDACSIGLVRYLDYEREAPSTDNFFNLAMHKRAFFAYEHEVRVAATVTPFRQLNLPEQPPSTPPFLTYAIPFDAFEQIVLSPYAPTWFLPLVVDLLRRYECLIPIKQSSMT
jgi:hypothetical protein